MSGDERCRRLDEQEALRIACPEDPDAFKRYLTAVAPLATLPKAHLHIHTNAIQRNCDVKRALAAFNETPGRLVKARVTFPCHPLTTSGTEWAAVAITTWSSIWWEKASTRACSGSQATRSVSTSTSGKILTHFQASEDARSEGIRWVEYCGANGAPQAT
eukprot:342041-Rhodomonas_salina.1